jgi:hypothetical protein
MPLTKKYKFGGLDVQNSHLNREDSRATEIRNFLLNHGQELESRNGQLEFTDYTRVGDTSIDVIDFLSKGLEGQEQEELLVFSSDSSTNKLYCKRVNADLTVSNIPTSGTFTSISKFLPHTSNRDIFYFLVNGQLMKYDGVEICKAGLPDPVLSTSTQGNARFTFAGSGANIYIKAMLLKFDCKNNLIVSDYITDAAGDPIFGAYGTTLTLGRSTSAGLEDGHKFIEVTALTTSPTVAFTGICNFVAGDFVTFRISGDGAMSTNVLELVRLEVESVGVGTVTFKQDKYYYYVLDYASSDIVGYWERLDTNYFDTFNIIPSGWHSNYMIAVYGSPTNGNYLLSATVMIGDSTWTTSLGGVGSTTANYGWFPAQLVNLADWYDDTANFQRFPDNLVGLTSQNNLLLCADPKIVSFSSNAAGASIEMIEPTNNFLVGSSADGNIAGLFSNEDFLFIGKDRELYYLIGDLNTGSVKMRPFRTTGIGCVGQNMIGSFASWPVFLSQRGFFFCKTAGDIDEISDIIEPIFTANLYGAMTPNKFVLDIYNEYAYFVFTERIMAFHYKTKEWMVLDSMPLAGGIDIFQKILWMADSDGKLYYESGNMDKGTSEIPLLYSTNWEHDGEPSLEKQFSNFKLFSLSPDKPQFSINVAFQSDWTETDLNTQVISFTTQRFQKCRPIKNNSFSMRAIITNAKCGEKVIISGWEYDVTLIQDKIKQ